MVFGLAGDGALVAGVRLGLLQRLASGPPADAAALARQLELDEAGTRLLCDSLAALGYVTAAGAPPAYGMSRRWRRWFDPASATYVGTYVAHGRDYLRWWERLEDVLRGAHHEEIHGDDPDDPHWETYIRGQYELARLSAPEVARAIDLPKGATSLLDLAGGHGWFAAALCRRHKRLTATVIDLPGSARIGRAIVAEAGMADRVRFVEGDLAVADLGGPHDGVLAFNIVHHLSPEQVVALLRRLHAALRAGGTLAILDLWARPADEPPDSKSLLGLFFYLTSGAATYSPDQLRGWLAETGFDQPKAVRIKRNPSQTLFVTHRR
jgi:ubiquinone/menaquinone biosynthesis C-methylase UbiE